MRIHCLEMMRILQNRINEDGKKNKKEKEKKVKIELTRNEIQQKEENGKHIRRHQPK